MRPRYALTRMRAGTNSQTIRTAAVPHSEKQRHREAGGRLGTLLDILLAISRETRAHRMGFTNRDMICNAKVSGESTQESVCVVK